MAFFRFLIEICLKNRVFNDFFSIRKARQNIFYEEPFYMVVL